MIKTIIRETSECAESYVVTLLCVFAWWLVWDTCCTLQ